MPTTYDADSFLHTLGKLVKAMNHADKDDEDEDTAAVLEAIHERMDDLDTKHTNGHNRLLAYHEQLQRAYAAQQYGSFRTQKAMAKRLRKVEKLLRRARRG